MPPAPAFILYRLDAQGPDLNSVLKTVRATPNVDILRRSRDAVLVQGPGDVVLLMTSRMVGWHVEQDYTTQAAG